MRHPLLPSLVLLAGLPCCGPGAAEAASDEQLVFLSGTIDSLRAAAREHRELLDRETPLLPSDPECDALLADFRAVLAPALVPGVIEDWSDLVVRTGLLSFYYQLCPEGQVVYGPPRPFTAPDGAAGARVQVDYPSAAGDPERHDLVLIETDDGWRLCRRPLLADHPEQEVALALDMGLLPCAPGASEGFLRTLAGLVDAGPQLRLLERVEDGPSLRLRVQVTADGLDAPLEFTAVHELSGWVARE
ncbi:MAG: hypothetical protein H8E31_06205 [Planctomycetes bacterium]|nr:hypothetical protein [Planctomycetota bacterium]